MKTSQSFGVHFTIRADKEKEGKAPVYACITVNKKRCYIALKQSVDINYWDNVKGEFKGTREEFKQINKYLQDFQLTLGGFLSTADAKGKESHSPIDEGSLLWEYRRSADTEQPF